MKITYTKDPLLHKVELRRTPVIIRVNKFDEKSAQEFSEKMSDAHNTGQPVIPIVIDIFIWSKRYAFYGSKRHRYDS